MAPRLALVAGSGTLPARIVEACRAEGRPLFVVGIEGQTDPAVVAGVPHVWIRLGAAACAFARLRAEGVADVVLAGAVRRPSIAELRPDLATLRFLTRALAAGGGDDALLRRIVRAIEAEGFRVVAPETVLGDLTVSPGTLGSVSVPEDCRDDIRRGVAVVRALGLADVGQAAVVQQGIVLAVEAAEGTDELLARAGALRRAGPGGVLVKLPKPGQEARVDSPAIGPGTVAGAVAAGLRGIAVAAGATLVLDRAATVAAADAGGLFLLGLDREAPL